MKRIVIGAAMAAGVLFVLRRFGPALRERAEAKCQELMARRRADAGAKFSDRDLAWASAPADGAVVPG